MIAHKQLREWLLNVPCVPLLPTTLPDLFHAGQPVLIGLQATHGSHKLAYKRCIWWCVACGSWASSAARNLSRPCAGQVTKAARDVLARLDKGLTPQPHVQWQSPHYKRVHLCGLECGIRTEPRAPTQGPCTAVWGHPQENPGRRPKNRAVIVAVLLSRDCFGATTHRGVSALTRTPSSKRDKIISLYLYNVPFFVGDLFSWYMSDVRCMLCCFALYSL